MAQNTLGTFVSRVKVCRFSVLWRNGIFGFQPDMLCVKVTCTCWFIWSGKRLIICLENLKCRQKQSENVEASENCPLTNYDTYREDKVPSPAESKSQDPGKFKNVLQRKFGCRLLSLVDSFLYCWLGPFLPVGTPAAISVPSSLEGGGTGRASDFQRVGRRGFLRNFAGPRFATWSARSQFVT